MADKDKKEKKIVTARALFEKHLPAVKAGTMTSTQFRSEVITGTMAASGAPMNSAATMYQLILSEKKLTDKTLDKLLARVAKVKEPKTPKVKATKATSKPASKTSKAKSTAAGVTSDPNGTWEVGNGSKTYKFTSRDRARTAKAKLGEGWSITAPKATGKTATAAN